MVQTYPRLIQRVIVCGGRDYDDRNFLFGRLWTLHGERGPFTRLYHGDAKGADRLAEEWAVAAGVHYVPVAAKWYRPDGSLDRGAGIRRNGHMLALARPDLVIAFPGGNGTANMVERARAAGVEVVDYGDPDAL